MEAITIAAQPANPMSDGHHWAVRASNLDLLRVVDKLKCTHCCRPLTGDWFLSSLGQARDRGFWSPDHRPEDPVWLAAFVAEAVPELLRRLDLGIARFVFECVITASHETEGNLEKARVLVNDLLACHPGIADAITGSIDAEVAERWLPAVAGYEATPIGDAIY